jgi:hypothetical protein
LEDEIDEAAVHAKAALHWEIGHKLSALEKQLGKLLEPTTVEKLKGSATAMVAVLKFKNSLSKHRQQKNNGSETPASSSSAGAGTTPQGSVEKE